MIIQVTMNGEQASVAINAVSLILAVGSVLSPLIFGFVLWKMSQIFVSKTEFNEFKTAIEKKNDRDVERLDEINDSLIELLQRTAHLREKG